MGDTSDSYNHAGTIEGGDRRSLENIGQGGDNGDHGHNSVDTVGDGDEESNEGMKTAPGRLHNGGHRHTKGRRLQHWWWYPYWTWLTSWTVISQSNDNV